MHEVPYLCFVLRVVGCCGISAASQRRVAARGSAVDLGNRATVYSRQQVTREYRYLKGSSES